MGDVCDVITCAKFQIEIFMGYDFTGGRIFDVPIDFSMGLTTVQRYCATCDDHGLHDSAGTVLTAITLSYGKWRNSTPRRIKTPSLVEMKL